MAPPAHRRRPPRRHARPAPTRPLRARRPAAAGRRAGAAPAARHRRRPAVEPCGSPGCWWWAACWPWWSATPWSPQGQVRLADDQQSQVTAATAAQKAPRWRWPKRPRRRWWWPRPRRQGLVAPATVVDLPAGAAQRTAARSPDRTAPRAPAEPVSPSVLLGRRSRAMRLVLVAGLHGPGGAAGGRPGALPPALRLPVRLRAHPDGHRPRRAGRDLRPQRRGAGRDR